MSELTKTGQEILDRAVAAAQRLYSERYSDAKVIFLAGSIVRGEGTATSDLDLIVVYEKLEPARRETYIYDGFPVECFIHDPETLNYFYDLARPGGFNPMAQMVLEGIEIPGPSEFSARIKALARGYYEPGPPALTADDILLARYSISNLLDDLDEPRSKWELTGTGTELYKSLADLYLRANGKWLAKNKSIPRALLKADPELQQHFCEAFEELFAAGKTEKVAALTGEILAPHGGFIVDGFMHSASPGARKKLDQYLS